MKKHYLNVGTEEVQQVVREAVGRVFTGVLEDADISQQRPMGQAAFWRFFPSLRLVE